ncbi:MAG: glycosyltransferase family 4 protein [Caldilineaceae bacterium]
MTYALIASGCFIGTSALYRCVHLREQLAEIGVTADVVDWTIPRDIPSGPALERMLDVDLLVLHRVAMGNELARVVERVQYAGGTVVFDTDDLVFEPQLIHWHRGVARLSDQEKAQYADGVSQYLATLKSSDAVMTATPFLSELARRRNRDAFTHRNALGHEMHRLTSGLRKERMDREPSERVVIGYGSGTATHDVDFQQAAPAMLEILSRNPSVELWLAGPLDVGAAFARFGNRVRHFPLSDWKEWLRLASHFDINLAPLEADNVFCRAKSEIKFVEAGAMGIPTVATRIDSFADAITPGVDGLLVDGPNEWLVALDGLIHEPERREAMGAAAEKTVAQEYSLAARARELGTLIAQLTGSTIEPGEHGGSMRLSEAGPRDNTDAEKPLASKAVRPMNSQRSTPLVLNWLVSEPFRGSGGHTTLFRMVKHLVDFGHECHLYIPRVEEMTDHTSAALRAYVDANFMVTGAIFHPWNGTVTDADATIATQWTTVDDLDELYNGGRRYYFVQDFEPSFYPMGSDYVRAENTYRKGVHCITIGSWLARMLRERYRARADHFDFAVDGEIYYPRAVEQPISPRVAFYARPSTPRRAYQLGIEALRLVKARRPDAEVALFGSEQLVPRPGFDHTNLGVLTPYELAALYSSCDAGLVLSLTNPSLVPFEMMACRCPVVEMRSEQSEELLEHEETAWLADPTPEKLADGVLRLLEDRCLRDHIAEQGFQHVQGRTWRESARQFEAILLRYAPAEEERCINRRTDSQQAETLLWQLNRLRGSQQDNEQLIEELRDSLYRTLAEKALIAAQTPVTESAPNRGLPSLGEQVEDRLNRLRNRAYQYIPGWILGAAPVSPIVVGEHGLWQTFRADRSHLSRIELMFASLDRRRDQAIRLVVYEGAGNRLLAERTVSQADLMPYAPYVITFAPRVDSYQQHYTVGILRSGSPTSSGLAMWRYWWPQHSDAGLRQGKRRVRGQLAFQALYGESEREISVGRTGPRNSVAPPKFIASVAGQFVTAGARLAREALRLVITARTSLRDRGVDGLAEDVIEYLRWRTSSSGDDGRR